MILFLSPKTKFIFRRQMKCIFFCSLFIRNISQYIIIALAIVSVSLWWWFLSLFFSLVFFFCIPSHCTWEKNVRDTYNCLCCATAAKLKKNNNSNNNKKWSSLRWIRLRLSYFHYFLIRLVFICLRVLMCTDPILKFSSPFSLSFFFTSLNICWIFKFSMQEFFSISIWFIFIFNCSKSSNILVGWWSKFRFQFVEFSNNFFLCIACCWLSQLLFAKSYENFFFFSDLKRNKKEEEEESKHANRLQWLKSRLFLHCA